MAGADRHYPFLSYPPIQAHGVIGDRRTAALVAADGTIDWHCLPDYDGDPLFGSLLDADRGGFWRLGPRTPVLGIQRYLEKTAVLLTEWELPGAKLELCDAMLWPDDERPHLETARCIVRRLRCIAGRADVEFRLVPRLGFADMEAVQLDAGHVSFRAADRRFLAWSSFPIQAAEGALTASVTLSEGEVLWAAFGEGMPLEKGAAGAENARQLEDLLERTVSYWKEWCRDLTVTPNERQQIERSAITVHLLTFAPAGSAVAAVTSSLPERLGGDLNWDYRFAWVRDTSLALALLALLGKSDEVGKYLDWLSERSSLTDAPLQVMYHADGRRKLRPVSIPALAGYRQSRPVRFGNRAYRQRQNGSEGYLADCTLIYLENGGRWKTQYWELIRRVADHTAQLWREPDCGIWELPDPVHWVTSKVMSWVVLDRAIRIAELTGCAGEAQRWLPVRDEIRREVLELGWSESAGSFRQHYGNDEVDASLLLMAVMEFLPPDDPRLAATVSRIERELTVDGFVYRFRPQKTPGVHSELPLGSFEGAFFPCTFWLATAYVKAGMADKAEAILDRCQKAAGSPGIFAEEIDTGSRAFLGNTPLLFSQVEYARARLAIAHHRALSGTSFDAP